MSHVIRDQFPGVGTNGRVPTPLRSVGRSGFALIGRATSSARPVPEFLIIGAKRAGTTSLFRYLEEHPNIAPLFPSARSPLMRSNQKGVHFFDANWHRGERWYRAHFQTEHRRSRHSQITGEASPYYLFHPLAAGRAKQIVPNAKIVVLVSEPVARTYSAWSEQRRNGVERLSFADAIEVEAARMGDDDRRLRVGDIARSFSHEFQSYARQSEYGNSLTRWSKIFPQEQMLVVRSEDLYERPMEVLHRVTGFLGLEPHAPSEIRAWNASEADPIDETLRARLRARFQADRTMLAEQFGIAWD